jgi:phosphatidylglycerophosphate synthase
VAPTAPAGAPFPGFDLLVRNYAGKIRVLAILWFVYAALSVLAGFAGLAFLRAFLSGGFGSWMGGSAPPTWVLPAILHFAWIALTIRAILAVIAGWGLLERTQWGRIVAIVAAILALIRFPLGTALGIATLVILLGSRNSALYEQV